MSQVLTAERCELELVEMISTKWSIILASGGWDEEAGEPMWGGRCLAECDTMVQAVSLVERWAVGAPLMWPEECHDGVSIIVATNPEGRRVFFRPPFVIDD